jgi:hypothetical protein
MPKSDFSNLVVHAPNIHNGGGKALLSALIDCIKSHEDVRMNLNSRMLESFSINEGKNKFFFKSTFMDRFIAEKNLKKIVHSSSDIVLCLGNLPPLFKLPGRIILFLQNRKLIPELNIHCLK